MKFCSQLRSKIQSWPEFVLVWPLIPQAPLQSSFLGGYRDADRPTGLPILTSTELHTCMVLHRSTENKAPALESSQAKFRPVAP